MGIILQESSVLLSQVMYTSIMWNSAKKAFFDYRGKRIVSRVVEVLAEVGVESVLDVGAGTMAISKMIADAGYRVEGCDVVDENLTDLRLKMFDGTKLDYKDDSFDSVILLFVLHHTSFENQEKLFAECARVAKKVVVIGEDVYRNPFERMVVRVLDFIGNRLNSKEIPVPGTFRNEEGWEKFLGGFKEVELFRVATVVPLPFRPTRHRLFVSKCS